MALCRSAWASAPSADTSPKTCSASSAGVRRSCASATSLAGPVAATSLAGPVAAAIAKLGHDRGGQPVDRPATSHVIGCNKQSRRSTAQRSAALAAAAMTTLRTPRNLGQMRARPKFLRGRAFKTALSQCATGERGRGPIGRSRVPRREQHGFVSSGSFKRCRGASTGGSAASPTPDGGMHAAARHASPLERSRRYLDRERRSAITRWPSRFG
jgi:hypothetical protein